jgi:hypothetical protein
MNNGSKLAKDGSDPGANQRKTCLLDCGFSFFDLMNH